MVSVRFLRSFLLVALLFGNFATSAHADPVIFNGSFEVDAYFSFGLPAPPITGWNIVSGGDTIGFTNGEFGPTPYGNQFIELGAFGSIDQTVTGFTPGNFYDLTFATSSQWGSGVPQAEISFLSGSPTPTSTFTLTSGTDFINWQSFSVTFQASSSSVNIKLAQPNASLDDIALDNISVTPHITPEPSAFLLATLAGGACFTRTARRRA